MARAQTPTRQARLRGEREERERRGEGRCKEREREGKISNCLTTLLDTGNIGSNLKREMRKGEKWEREKQGRKQGNYPDYIAP